MFTLSPTSVFVLYSKLPTLGWGVILLRGKHTHMIMHELAHSLRRFREREKWGDALTGLRNEDFFFCLLDQI